MLHLGDLNPPQREAVTTVDGPLLVLAGAGSGKTRVITYRIVNLLLREVPAKQILALSFTNKAADEMRTRVDALAGKRARGCTLSTFHALGLAILKEEKAALGFASGFTIYDASDQLGTVKEILRRLYASDDDRRFDAKAILFRISRAKNAFVSPEEYGESIGDDEYDMTANVVYPEYQAALKSFHALDFDDLICEVVRLLDRDPAARARWAERFRYVMVDEYQDTNRAQFRMLEHLVRAHNNVCVVGDDDQSIYSWRGAEAGHILEFERHFPGARVVKLEENYRSTPQILDAANHVIAHNAKRHEKRLWTQRPARDLVQLIVCEDAEAEAEFVANEIAALGATRGVRPSEVAVLYRANVQSRPLEEAMRAVSLDYRLVGGQAFFERKEVKDAIAYLKLALSPRDELALRRVVNYPARGIGTTTLERVAEIAAAAAQPLFDCCQRPDDSIPERAKKALTGFCDLVERGRAHMQAGSLADGARAYLKDAGLFDELQAAAPTPMAAQKKLLNLEGFFTSLARFEEHRGRDLGAFLQRIALDVRESDDDDEPPDEVTLTTLHGSKGLEFRVVFLVGLEEELLPHRRTLFPDGPDVLDATPDLGEERRLFYVGITRAKELLYLCRAQRRGGRANGSQKLRSPSRFLDEIPPALYEVRDAEVPGGVSSPEDEAAFARAQLDKLLKLTS